MRAYLQRTTGRSRAQLARLIAAYLADGRVADGRVIFTNARQDRGRVDSYVEDIGAGLGERCHTGQFPLALRLPRTGVLQVCIFRRTLTPCRLTVNGRSEATLVPSGCFFDTASVTWLAEEVSRAGINIIPSLHAPAEAGVPKRTLAVPNSVRPPLEPHPAGNAGSPHNGRG